MKGNKKLISIGITAILCCVVLGMVFLTTTTNKKLPGEEKKEASVTSGDSKESPPQVEYHEPNDVTKDFMTAIEEQSLFEQLHGTSTDVPSVNGASIDTPTEDSTTDSTESSADDSSKKKSVSMETEHSETEETDKSEEDEHMHTHEETAESVATLRSADVPLDYVVNSIDGSSALFITATEETPEERAETVKDKIAAVMDMNYTVNNVIYYGLFDEGYVYKIDISVDESMFDKSSAIYDSRQVFRTV